MASELSISALHETSTKPQHVLGQKMELPNGDVFRYCKAGASNLVVGNVQQAPAPVANHVNQVIGVNASVGDITVTVTLGATAATADQYAGGYLVINDAAGEGHTYPIASHPAHAGSGDLVVTLREPVRVALTADTSEYTLVANPYNGVIIAPTTETGPAVGVAPIAIPATNYGWLQTRGVCSTLIQGTPGAGISVARSDTTAGAVEISDGILQPVGAMVNTGVSGEHNAVSLSID